METDLDAMVREMKAAGIETTEAQRDRWGMATNTRHMSAPTELLARFEVWLQGHCDRYELSWRKDHGCDSWFAGWANGRSMVGSAHAPDADTARIRAATAAARALRKERT